MRCHFFINLSKTIFVHFLLETHQMLVCNIFFSLYISKQTQNVHLQIMMTWWYLCSTCKKSISLFFINDHQRMKKLPVFFFLDHWFGYTIDILWYIYFLYFVKKSTKSIHQSIQNFFLFELMINITMCK